MTIVSARRPHRAPSPPMPPMDQLEETHRQMLLMLSQMDDLLLRLSLVGVDQVAQSLAAQIRDFFDLTAKSHHDQEDRVVFPVLLAAGDPVMAERIEQLRNDHGWIEENWRELGPQLDGLAHGHTWIELESLRRMIEIFRQLHAEHIALEESLVYPQARKQQEVVREQTERRLAELTEEISIELGTMA
jgi:hemerythrin-like domain-containing protein